MDKLMQDIRYAFRSFRQRPGFSAAAVLTLALGVGATIGIYSVVQGIVLRPLPFPDPDRIVVLGQVTPERDGRDLARVSHLNFLDLRAAARSFESMALFESASVTVTGLGDATATPGAQVSADFFRVMGVPLMLGRTFTAEEMMPGGPRAIIISHAFWQDRLGGASDVLEQTLSISGIPRPIVGVTPPGFEYPAGARVYAPIRPNDEACGRGCAFLMGIGRLAPGVSRQQAEQELAAIARRLEVEHPATNAGVSVRTLTLLDYVVGDVRPALLVLMAAVFMVLLIACANVANLVLARGASRGAELTLRSVLGASRARVLRQLMTENLMLALTGAILGVLLATWGVSALRNLAPPEMPRVAEIALDGGALLFAVVLVLLTSLVFGLLPALRLSRTRLSGILRGGRSEVGPRQGWGRFSILVAEVTLAVMLLLGAGLLLRTLASMQNVELGFEPQGVAVFTVGLPGATYATAERRALFFAELTERLAALPDVQSAGVVTPAPLSGGGSTPGAFQRVDALAEAGYEPAARLRSADAGGLRALGVGVLSGRTFGPQDRVDSEPVALINASAAARYWPDGDALGRQIRVGSGGAFEEQPRTIIGIVQDFRGVAVTQAPEPEVILPFVQLGSSAASFVVRSANPAATLIAARAQVGAIDANLPLVNPRRMADVVLEQSAGTRFYLMMIGIFAALAAALAAIGIYGVVAFLVAQRNREIGVRMALGARVREIVALVLWQGLGPALVGLLLGLAGALLASRVIAGMLYGVAPHDPWTYGAVSALLIGIAGLACIIPARRASSISPASALRGE